jgi:hypothetical protein
VSSGVPQPAKRPRPVRHYILGPEKPWWFPGWPSFRDFAGGGIIAFSGFVLWGSLTAGTEEGVKLAVSQAGVLGTATGAVLGFWYGERGRRTAEERAEIAVEDRAVLKQSLDEAQRQLLEARNLLSQVELFTGGLPPGGSPQGADAPEVDGDPDGRTQAEQPAPEPTPSGPNGSPDPS